MILPTIAVGAPAPLGATWDGTGTNFAVYSEHATRIDLCLFDSPDAHAESARVPLPGRTGNVRHGYAEGVGPGQLYGYRAEGAYQPAAALRFNASKLLFDPYARAAGRTLRWDASLFPYGLAANDPLAADHRDSAPFAPLAAVVDGSFDWRGDRRPQVAWKDTILYEVHVRGFTLRHPEVPEQLRGTFAGLASPPALRHLRELGITTVELLPVQLHALDHHLAARGLTNYWGYNTLGFFAPDPRLAADRSPRGTVRELKEMVRTLHDAGIEVVLDVVYNHTPEGDHLGPLLSLRGLDDATYYRLEPPPQGAAEMRHYQDFTGCGNTLNLQHPAVVRLVLDSLRYWAAEMHVDGFRFDLATALARDAGGHFDPQAPLLREIAADPLLSQLKLIAEPWDARLDGFRLGGFPGGWREWNARYRDGVRRFWRGEADRVGELATRITGSSDVFAAPPRGPTASINFVTCHDGMTLADVVSYDHKHNEANHEGNADGVNVNFSWNSGHEGPTADPAILERRRRRQAAMLATLLFSQGVPMLLGGDEIGRTQRGNNNAYCQDNELSWFDWQLGPDQKRLHDLTCRLVAARKRFRELRRERFFSGARDPIHDHRDITWLAPDGSEMTEHAWHHPPLPFLGALLPSRHHEPLLLLFNAGESIVDFPLPQTPRPCWQAVVDTAAEDGAAGALLGGTTYRVEAWSTVLLVGV